MLFFLNFPVFICDSLCETLHDSCSWISSRAQICWNEMFFIFCLRCSTSNIGLISSKTEKMRNFAYRSTYSYSYVCTCWSKHIITKIYSHSYRYLSKYVHSMFIFSSFIPLLHLPPSLGYQRWRNNSKYKQIVALCIDFILIYNIKSKTICMPNVMQIDFHPHFFIFSQFFSPLYFWIVRACFLFLLSMSFSFIFHPSCAWIKRILANKCIL